ncbi:MAG: ABC transporter permease [Chlorobiaceae bacterium]|nr:ABC transporter permease [Chlorobiaceae bacterium]
MGILKAIGTSRFQLFRIYVLMLLVIGALAGLIAIPASLLSGWAFAHFVAGKLNFNIITTTLPLFVYITLILASLLMPALLSVSILLKGTGTSVREALSDYGISQTTVGREFPFLKTLHLSERMMLAIRNSLRNMSRLTVTVFAMAFGVAIFSTGFNVRQSLWELLTGYKEEMRYDVQVVLN